MEEQISLSPKEQEAYQQAALWDSLARNRGWQRVVRPYLVDKLNQSFPDPSAFKNRDEFDYAALTASVFKKVISEFLVLVESKQGEKKYYEDKMDGKIVRKKRVGE